MKTKLYAKKTLSVFMAVMMLLSAWVFVAPEHNHASAVSSSSVSSANSAELAKVTGSTEVTNFLYGRYEHDDSWTSDEYYSQIYNRLLYVTQVYQSSPSASLTSQKLSDSNAVSLHWYNPIVTMVYDGGKNIPSVGVMINTDANNNCRVRTYSVYPYSNANGLTLAGNWHGIDGRLNYTYCHFNAVVNGNASGRNVNCATPDGTINSSYAWTTESNAETFYTNVLRFTGTMSDTEYLRTLNPTFRWRGNQRSQGTGTVYDRDLTTTSTISVINIVPWTKAVENGVAVYNEIAANPAKYTTESVKKYAELAKALLDANPNNYINSSVNNTTGWASAAESAVNAYNSWSGLEAQKYNITFQDNSGKTYVHSYDYGASVDCAALAATHTNTISQLNDQSHQTYVWDTSKYVSTVTDDVVITESLGSAVNHTWTGWTQNTNDHTRSCTVCGYVFTQAHIRGDGYVTKNESCTEDGEKTFDCKTCGKKAIATETINDITGHQFTGDIVEKVAGKDGYHWKKCIRFDECGVYGWGETEGECEAHKWPAQPYESKASSCNENGYEKYRCSVCSATYTKELDLASHTIKATAEKNVTNVCGGDGYKAFWSCTVCGRVWEDAGCTNELSDTTDADNDGIPDKLETKGPDHEFTGSYVSVSGGVDGKHKRQCRYFTQCGTYSEEETHSWGEPKVTPSTCEIQGKEVYTCVCGQERTVELELAEHNMETIDAVTPDCEKAGNNKYYHCTTCNKYYKDEAGKTVTTVKAETLAALGHEWTAHHDYDTLVSVATCMNKAVYKNHCDRCKAEIYGTHEYGEVDKVNGHKFNGAIKENSNGTHSYKCTVEGCPDYSTGTDCNFELTLDVPSTCHTLGYTIETCKDCKYERETLKTAYDFNNHDGEEEIRGSFPANCGFEGSTGSVYCLGCGAKKKDATVIPIDPDNHYNMVSYDRVDSTCQTEGHEAYSQCTQCKEYGVEKVVIPVKAHVYTTYNSNGNGTHTAECDTCKADIADKATDTKPCEGGVANCVEKKVCTVCSEEYGEVDKNNHKDIIFVGKVDSTCQTLGHEAYRYCNACKVNVDTPVEIGLKDHKYGAWTKIEGKNQHTRSCETCPAEFTPDTQTADCNGGTAYCNAVARCADCKQTYGDVNPANHTTDEIVIINQKDASCCEEGYTGDQHYKCCNALKKQGTAIPKADHEYTVEVEGSRVAATCIAKGEVTFKCAKCPEGFTPATQKKELDIDADNHASDDTERVNERAATCESDGYTGDLYYSCCYDAEKTAEENRKALKEKGNVIKANGQHVYSEAVPEYMIAQIKDTTDDDGKVIKREIVLKTEAPAYAEKITFRHADGKWYHTQICTICHERVDSACYTYAHTYNCVETDICEVCEGLCSLKDSEKHKSDLVAVDDDAKEATCVEDGKSGYYKCEDCDKTYFDEAGKKPLDLTSEADLAKLVISKNTVSHKWDEGKETQGTCGTSGTILYTCTVANCGATKEVSTGVSSQNHTWKTEYDIIKEATCGSNGYKAIKCSVCGSVKPNSAELIPSTGEHDYDTDKDGDVDRDDAVIVAGESCQKPGTITYTCTVCGNKDVQEDFDGVSAHKWGEWIVKGGDCQSAVIQERECTVCHEKEQNVISAGQHDFEVKVRVEPTPEADGYVIYICKNCKFETDPEVIKYNPDGEGGGSGEGGSGEGSGDAEGDKHVFNKEEYTIVKEATCKNGEIRRYTCLICGEKVEEEATEPLEHVWIEQKAEAPTCDKPGHNTYYICVAINCGAMYGEGKIEYPATGHNDADGNGKCDTCNEAYYNNGASTCGCICHKENFISRIIFKILNFFWKLFKIGRTCDCGTVHY